VSDVVAEWKRVLDEQIVINSVGISAVTFALKPSQKAAVYGASYPYCLTSAPCLERACCPGPPHLNFWSRALFDQVLFRH